MKITIDRMDDMHVHLREGSLLVNVLPYTARQCGRALVMPNLLEPVVDGAGVFAYRDRILDILATWDLDFTPLMTIKILPSTTKEMIVGAVKAGAIAGKVYPEGVTTNSSDGAKSMKALFPQFSAMQDAGMVLCLHGEDPGAFCLDREESFLHDLCDIVTVFPNLKVVLEHVTTAVAVQAIENYGDNVAGTITAHHLMLTLDDVIGGSLNPHAFCKPVAKRPSDRLALRKAATTSGKFFLGSDSAPHRREKKECSSGCAGVFTAPILAELLAEVFEEEGRLDQLEGFTSKAGGKFYGLPPATGTLTLEKTPQQVPDLYQGVVPMRAGQPLQWTCQYPR